MNLQKTSASFRKLQNAKSQTQFNLPLTSLMDEIGELKKELVGIKTKKVIPYEKYEKQKSKIKSQFGLEEEECILLKAQKNSMKRQLQQTKKQLQEERISKNQIKKQFISEQNKNRELEQKIYKAQLQNQKLQKSVDFCKLQMKQLCEQLEDLKKLNIKNKQTVIERRSRKEQIQKIKAIDGIRALIRQHRQNQN